MIYFSSNYGMKIFFHIEYINNAISKYRTTDKNINHRSQSDNQAVRLDSNTLYQFSAFCIFIYIV